MRSFIFISAFGCLLVVGCVGSAPSSGDNGSGSDSPGGGSGGGDTPDATNNTPDQNAMGGPVVGGQAPAGIFVSASKGSDDGTGSEVNPLKSLAKAVALAQTKNLPVNACAETYVESLTVVDGVSMYGYFDCSVSPWPRGTAHAQIVSPTSPAIFAHAITSATRIEGFDAIAPDFDGMTATDADGSSIGLYVRDSKGLTISEALIHAGKAAGGADGSGAAVNSVTATFYPRSSRNQGGSSCAVAVEDCSRKVIAGALGGSYTCAIGPNGGSGGQAGDPLFIYQDATGHEQSSTGPRNFHGRPYVGTAETAESEDNGVAGNEGNDGANGGWLLTAGGFVRGNGGVGSAGAPGQGGGGGHSSDDFYATTGYPISYALLNTSPYWVTGMGSGGGSGGCAGQAGTPGTGGGASIGALVVSSTVTFENATIESSAGGRAGKGALGSLSTAGQLAGGQTVVYAGVIIGGKGGDGGAGGNGGASGHGAPGPSIALAYSGPHPTLTSTTLTPGPAGDGQPELRESSSVGDKVLPAVVGISEAEHQFN